MHASAARTPTGRRCAGRRAGISWIGALVALGLAVAIPAGAYYLIPWQGSQGAGPLTHPVKRGVFTLVVTEKGEVQSSSNVEVRCRVKSNNSAGTAILEVVPEGTYVQEGDLLLRFDSSALENDLNLQQITVNSSKALMIEAENVLNAAKIALEEYLEGTFRQEEETIQNEIFVAEENLRRAEDYALFSEQLAAKGYVTELQLEGDRFAVDRSRKELEIAEVKLDVLRRFTKKKMVGQFESDIRIAEARYDSAMKTYQLDTDKLALIEEQIAACKVLAPAQGQVVYANDRDRRSDSEFVVEEGAVVRENQVVIRLPDPQRMQVEAEINESRIDHVRPGQYVSIRFDAIPGVELDGEVIKVNEYPSAGNWFSSYVQEYETKIRIDNPPESLRPGMTAQVTIYVEQQSDVLQVPVQAVFERAGAHWCIVDVGQQRLEARQIQIGSTNDSFVIVDDGLSDQDHVLLHPRDYTDEVKLPEVAIVSAEEKIRELPTIEDDPQDDEAGEAVARTERPQGDQAQDGQARGGMDFSQMSAGQLAAGMFERYDADKDGKLNREEMPERGRENFDNTDSNSDGFVDRTEMIAALNKLKQRMAGAGAGGPPAAGAGS